jgi:DNA-binding MarR family transcriptional regulator
MEKTEKTEYFLAHLIQLIGRLTFPMEKVYKIIGTNAKLLRAFNSCDGTITQAEIAKKHRIDPGNFSRTVNRWVLNGIAFRIGSGKDARLVHIYPVPPAPPKDIKEKMA